MQQLAAKFSRLHIAQHIAAQRSHGVRQSRRAKSRIKFLGDRAPANDFPAFQHYRLEAALGQIKRRH